MTAAAVADIASEVRLMRADDVPFVWETSLKVRKPHPVPWGAWLATRGDALRALLDDAASTVRVMEAQGVIVGFAHFVGDVLQMLYVKRDLRGLGFGEALLGAHGTPLLVREPNACFRRWAFVKGLRWRAAR